MKKIKLLLAAVAAMATLSVQAWDGSEGKVYLQNVGSGLWWGAGNDWGTRASLVQHPEYVTLHLNEGKYRLESQVSNGGSAIYFNGDWMDNASPVDLTITEVSTGIYTIANGETYYGFDGAAIGSIAGCVLGKGVDSSTDNGKWRIFTQDEMMASLDAATLENGVDATFLILDQSFGRNNRNTEFKKNEYLKGAWSMSASNLDKAGNNVNQCLESYHANFTLSQVLNGVPNGEYELRAQGFYRQDGSDNTHLPVFYINDGTATFPVKTGSENSMTDASNSFTAGNYFIDPIRVTVGDGKITLGAKLEGNTSLWCIFDNFTLTFYGIDLSAYQAEITTLRSTLTSIVEEAQPMNATVLATANTALSETASVDYNQVAMETAITQLNSAIVAANASIANYAAAKAYLDACNTLDAAGQASYAANETVVAVQTAYDNRTLEALTDEQKSAMDAAVLVAVRVQTTAGSDWTLALVNPGFELGNVTGWTNSGTQAAGAQGNKVFDNTQGDYYAERWHQDGTVDLNQTVTDLPSGVYEIGAYLYTDTNTGVLYANDIQTSFKTSGWYTVQVAIDNGGSIKFGAGCTLTTSTWICMDGFKLTLVSAGLPEVEAVTGKMNAEVATAQTTAIETYNANKTVANYNAASAAIAAAETSKAAYEKAATALADANALKDAHNFATAAATTTFAEAIAVAQAKYDEGTLTNDEANAGGNLGTVVVGWHADATSTPAAVYMKSAMAEVYTVNDWSLEGETDGSDFRVPFFEYWTADANSLAAKTMSGTLNELPNGQYKISALIRVRTKNGVAATDATGVTLDVNGGDATDATEGTQVGETQFTLSTVEALGLVKDGKLTFNVKVLDGTNISWLSFKNVKYTKVRDLTPEEEFVAATAEDYEALNDAITAGEAKTLGFDAGDYAPYNNIDAIALLAAAKAINQEAENAQEDVQAATTALTGATWTANAEELNAVYDGTFAAATNNGAPAGWRMSNNTLGGEYHSRAFVGDDRLAEFNGTNSGLFIRFDGTNSSRGSMYYYGDTENYTMPLKAGVTYYVKVDFAGWGSTGKPLRLNLTGPAGFEAKNQQFNTSVRADNADNTPQQFLIVFTATVAGNYVISFQTPGQDSNTHNAVISNVEVFRATPATMKISDAQYATFVAPFAVTIPDGVTAYTVTNAASAILNMEEVKTTIPANTPVVLFKETALDATVFYGRPVDGTPEYGWLTGVYAATPAPVGSYVLQNNDSKVGFYPVIGGQQPTVGANRAYLSAPAGVKADAFFFDEGTATAIKSVFDGVAAGEVYDLAGRKLQKLQKGVNIVNGKKVLVK